MKAKIALPILLVIILIGIFIWQRPERDVAAPQPTPLSAPREAARDEAPLDEHSEPFEMPQGNPFVGLSEEGAKERLQSTRNLIAADPSLPDEVREQQIANLNAVYAGQFGAAPAMSAADLEEQERLRAVIENYKAELDQVKRDAGLSREEQKAEIRRIVREYMQQLEGVGN